MQSTRSKLKNTDCKYPAALKFYFLAILLPTLLVFGCNGSLSSKNTNPIILKARALEIITQALDDQDPRIRANAIEVIAATGQTRLMPKVQRLLKDNSVGIKFAAALAIGDTKYKLAKTSLQSSLNDPDQNVKIAAAYALSKIGSSNSLGIVRKAVASKDPIIRANAALLLGKSGDKGALRLLKWAAQDPDSDDRVRFSVLEARARLGDEKVLRRLWALVFSSYADDRDMAIRALGALGTEKAKDILITKLDDEVPEVRLSAAEQIGLLGDTTGEPEVIKALTTNRSPNLDQKDIDRLNIYAAMAIGQIRTQNLKNFLPKLLNNPSKRVRLAAAKAVFLSF